MGGCNIQNLLRPGSEVGANLSKAIDLVRRKDLPALKAEFKTPPLDVVGQLLRSVFIAKPGHKFVICDLGAVENRVLGYVAEDDTILEVFRKGLDPYLNFASKMYQVPYESLVVIKNGEHKAKDAAAKEMRQNAKPAVLGCLGAWTPVLTDSGWRPLVSISSTNLVYDGELFVRHEGVIKRGDKSVLDFCGTEVTPDHLILLEEDKWEECGNINTQCVQQALGLGFGKLLNMLDSGMTPEDTSASVSGAEKLKKFLHRIWNSERQHPAFRVPIRNYVKNAAAFTSNLNTSQEMLLTVLLTDIMRFYRAAGEKDIQRIVTQGEELLRNFQMYTVLYGTLSNWTVLITQFFSSIESTTTGITEKETLDSSHPQITTTIKRILDLWSGMASGFQLQDFGLNIAQNIEMPEPLHESFGEVLHRNELSRNKKTVVAPTYDILNAGPRNRFMILTNRGPMIVHNCGYMLSGGEETTSADGDKIFTGLMGYGRNMGIPLTKELADLSVKVFRDTHKGVVRCWDNLEKAAMYCIRTGKSRQVGPVRFDMVQNVMRMVLPSGRALHYVDPKIVEREWFGGTKQSIETWGMDQKLHIWGRIYTYGGKLIENAVQAISRDILVSGMKLATAMGFPIVLHCHDEIVAEVLKNSHLGIKQLREAMIARPKWGNDMLILDAAGFESDVYRKE